MTQATKLSTKLTVRVDQQALAAAKQYAEEHNTSLGRLISEFLALLQPGQQKVPATPMLRKLAGILPPEASIEDHRAHLVRKYDA